MSDLHKLEILRAISSNAEVNKSIRINLSALARTTDIPKEQIDILLIELDSDGFISEYVAEGSDDFTIILRQKGLDAVRDESFI